MPTCAPSAGRSAARSWATILASGVASGELPHVGAYVISYLVLGGAYLLAGVAAVVIPRARGASWQEALPGEPVDVVTAAESAAG